MYMMYKTRNCENSYKDVHDMWFTKQVDSHLTCLNLVIHDVTLFTCISLHCIGTCGTTGTWLIRDN